MLEKDRKSYRSFDDTTSLHARRKSLNSSGWTEAPASADAPKQRFSRLLDRNGRFHQSKGIFNIRRTGRQENVYFYLRDWFHSLVHLPSSILFISCILFYFFFIFAFAVVYFSIPDCSLDITTLIDACFFSAETMMTIGYATKDQYFHGCTYLMFIIAFQAIVGCFVDSVFITLIFVRLSRGNRRAETIIFSDKAVIRRVRGQPYFMFQVVELRKHQLCEAHVRCYAIRRHKGSDGGGFQPFQYVNMRLSHPDDNVCPFVLLVVPTVVVHRIDNWSPLMPPKRVVPCDYDPAHTFMYPDVFQRSGDAETGNRNDSTCGVCGEHYQSPRALAAHLRYNQQNDTVSGHDVRTACGTYGSSFPAYDSVMRHRRHAHGSEEEGGGDVPVAQELPSPPNHLRGLESGLLVHSDQGSMEDLKQGDSARNQRSFPMQSSPVDEQDDSLHNYQLQAYYAESNLEVLVVLEGQCATTGVCVQARHSYSYNAGDILFDHMFAQCVTESAEGSCRVDFNKLHDVHAVPKNVFCLDSVGSMA